MRSDSPSPEMQALFEVGAIGALADGPLLDRFVDGHDASAFEVIVRRHGPMVCLVTDARSTTTLLHQPGKGREGDAHRLDALPAVRGRVARNHGRLDWIRDRPAAGAVERPAIGSTSRSHSSR